MQPLLERLSEILSQEIAQYSKLLDILSVERHAIVGDSAERIHDILKQQETLILELKTLEEARVTIMDKFVEQFQTSTQKLTLLELATLVKEPFASEYKELSRQLGELLQQLEQVNRDNMYLIDHSLDYVNSALRLFAAADFFGVGYSSDTKNLKYRAQGKHIHKTA
jgi:flagellar biosynthesis/type III secretory pathway chaperone